MMPEREEQFRHFLAITSLEAPQRWQGVIQAMKEQFAETGEVHLVVNFIPPVNSDLQFIKTLRKRFSQYCKGLATLRTRSRRRKDGSVTIRLDIV
jgi:hypothetical protein